MEIDSTLTEEEASKLIEGIMSNIESTDVRLHEGLNDLRLVPRGRLRNAEVLWESVTHLYENHAPISDQQRKSKEHEDRWKCRQAALERAQVVNERTWFGFSDFVITYLPRILQKFPGDSVLASDSPKIARCWSRVARQVSREIHELKVFDCPIAEASRRSVCSDLRAVRARYASASQTSPC